MSRTWEQDCLHYWGRVLTGVDAHWCPEWDDLPIDETCDEFQACLCANKLRSLNE